MSVAPNLFLAVLPTILIGGVLVFAVEYLKLRVERKIREKRGETTSERIEKLSGALTDATNLIGGIERELSERHRLVEKLREDCVRYDQLAKLKATEVEAVVQSLRGELKLEGRRSFWQSALLSFIFFLAGVVVTVYLT